MTTYIIRVPISIHGTREYHVDAKNNVEALQLVKAGKGSLVGEDLVLYELRFTDMEENCEVR